MAWVRKLPRICYSERITGKPKVIGCLVGTGRFELPTPRTPSECSTRLSHVPTVGSRYRSKPNQAAGLTKEFYTSATIFVRCPLPTALQSSTDGNALTPHPIIAYPLSSARVAVPPPTARTGSSSPLDRCDPRLRVPSAQGDKSYNSAG